MPGPVIAVIMTCHNRRQTTVASIRCLLDQRVQGPVDVRLYLTDDGSTDGTAAAVAQLAAGARILDGDGHLFWAAGMARSEAAALEADPDYLLWLNDDTMMDPGALATMLALSRAHPGAIIVGATRDPGSGAKTYGARVRSSRWHPQRFAHVPLSDEVVAGDTFNGNLVLLPREVRRVVGAIDGAFPHAYADDDYGLRATALGIPILQAPGSLATCPDTHELPPRRRGIAAWRAAQDPKGLPWRAQVRYFRRHGGPSWPLVLLGQQAKTMVGR